MKKKIQKKKELTVSPLTPSTQVLVALGSIVVHAQEYFSGAGHEFDKHAIFSAIETPGVKDWLVAMDKMALLPVKR